jgi:hypothetical protein
VLAVTDGGDMWTDRKARNERRVVVAMARELARPMLAGVSGPRVSWLRRADRRIGVLRRLRARTLAAAYYHLEAAALAAAGVALALWW